VYGMTGAMKKAGGNALVSRARMTGSAMISSKRITIRTRMTTGQIDTI